MKQESREILFVVFVGVVLLGSFLGIAGYTIYRDFNPSFEVQVQESSKGVVHIMCPQWQGSGFIVGSRTIITARHINKGVKDFNITTNDGHVIHATRAISHKDYDISVIYVDDLTCIVENCEYKYPCGFSVIRGKHEVELKVLELGSIKDCKLGQEVFSIGSTDGIVNFNAVAKGNIQTLNNKLAEYVRGVSELGWSILFSMTPEGGGGNSGCPVFTMDGKVVGVWVGSKQPNLHYAIPIDVLVDDLDEIELMFIQDKYYCEEIAPVVDDPYYNYEEDNEYYRK